MGSSRLAVSLALVLCFVGLQGLVSGVLDYWDDPSHLHCRAHHMQFLLPSLLDDAVFALTVLDDNGKSHYLHNNSDCGTWVVMDSNGSVVVGAAYNGCFVREEDGYFVMTIVLQEVLQNKKFQYHKKDLKCSTLPAMDAPSVSDCAAIDRVDRIPCGNSSISRVLCQSIDCCYNPNDRVTPCYFGNRLTAHCNDEGNILVVLSKDLTLPHLMLQSIKVTDVDETSCNGFSVQRTPTFVGFRFPLSCSSVFRGAVDGFTYENAFLAEKETSTWRGSSVTRDSTMRLTVRCTFSQTGIVSTQVEVATLPPPPPISTSGPLMLEMRIAKDQQYTVYYTNQDYPVIKVLREPVFLEVRILQRTDPNLVLVLNNCWATSSVNPNDDLQWPVLFNGCPFTGDNYQTQLTSVVLQKVDFPSHYKRFIIRTFAFMDQNAYVALDGLVFFHCSASVCVPSATESCSIDCASRRRRMADAVVPGESVTVTSDGPVIFNVENLLADQEPIRGGLGGLAVSRSWLIGTAGVGCFLAALLIMVNLFKRRPMPTVTA